MNEGQAGKLGLYNKSGNHFKRAVFWQESNTGETGIAGSLQGLAA